MNFEVETDEKLIGDSKWSISDTRQSRWGRLILLIAGQFNRRGRFWNCVLDFEYASITLKKARKSILSIAGQFNTRVDWFVWTTLKMPGSRSFRSLDLILVSRSIIVFRYASTVSKGPSLLIAGRFGTTVYLSWVWRVFRCCFSRSQDYIPNDDSDAAMIL